MPFPQKGCVRFSVKCQFQFSSAVPRVIDEGVAGFSCSPFRLPRCVRGNFGEKVNCFTPGIELLIFILKQEIFQLGQNASCAFHALPLCFSIYNLLLLPKTNPFNQIQHPPQCPHACTCPIQL
jgi:hypothetical protein